jgi:hypothetical protein
MQQPLAIFGKLQALVSTSGWGPIFVKALEAPSFEAVLRREIVEPSHMTWHESPDLGPHAGFVSTVAEASLFVSALRRNQLKDLQRM